MKERSISKSEQKSKSKSKRNSSKNLPLSESDSEQDFKELYSLSISLLNKEKYDPAYEVDLNNIEEGSSYSDKYWIFAKIITIRKFEEKILCLFKTRFEAIVNLHMKHNSDVLLLPNKSYQIGLKNIRISQLNYPTSHHHIQLIVDSDKLEMNPLAEITENPSDFAYDSIKKIKGMPDNYHIHVFGIIKQKISFKNQKKETNKWFNKFTIIQIESCYSQDIVIFSKEELNWQINTPLLLFNVKTNTYQGKRGLVTTINTVSFNSFEEIRKIGEMTPSIKESEEWLKQNHVSDLIENKDVFKKIQKIQEIQYIPNEEQLCYLENCQIVSFGKNFSYNSCQKCKKKVMNKFCRNCQKQVRFQLKYYVIGIIGDCTGSLSILWNHQQIEKEMITKNLEADYQNFTKKWLLSSIRLWIKNDGKSELWNVVSIERYSKFNERISKIKKLVSYF